MFRNAVAAPPRLCIRPARTRRGQRGAAEVLSLFIPRDPDRQIGVHIIEPCLERVRVGGVAVEPCGHHGAAGGIVPAVGAVRVRHAAGRRSGPRSGRMRYCRNERPRPISVDGFMRGYEQPYRSCSPQRVRVGNRVVGRKEDLSGIALKQVHHCLRRPRQGCARRGGGLRCIRPGAENMLKVALQPSARSISTTCVHLVDVFAREGVDKHGAGGRRGNSRSVSRADSLPCGPAGLWRHFPRPICGSCTPPFPGCASSRWWRCSRAESHHSRPGKSSGTRAGSAPASTTKVMPRSFSACMRARQRLPGPVVLRRTACRPHSSSSPSQRILQRLVMS